MATVIVDAIHNIDARRWEQLPALYTDEVETDYTSLFGGEVQRQRRDAMIKGWQTLMTPIVTQHLLGPINVEIDGEQATAHCHVRGYHFAESAPSGATWMVAGHYVLRLNKQDGAWRISYFKFEKYYQTGNEKILQETAAPTPAS